MTMPKEGLNDLGQEVPDPTPMEPPIGYEPQESMFDVMKRMVEEYHLKQKLVDADLETPEEADDYGLEDDDVEQDPRFGPTPWEEGFDLPSDPAELARLRRALDQRMGRDHPEHAEAADRPLASAAGDPAPRARAAAGPASSSGPGEAAADVPPPNTTAKPR